MKTYRTMTTPGNGIGKEVMLVGREVMRAPAAADAGFGFELENFEWDGDHYRQHDAMVPKDGPGTLRDKDATLFGLVGGVQIPDHITLWGLRLKICQDFNQYANMRLTRILPGIDAPLKYYGPKDFDWVIVRKNSGDEYAGVGGRVHQGHPTEAATDVSMMTRAGVERIMHFAFKLARSRPHKLLIVITKSNVQRHAIVMWDEIAAQIVKEFPGIKWDKELVNTATAYMVDRPTTLGAIITTNLHADILSDLAAVLASSLGIAPIGNIDPEHRYPSIFGPVRGPAFDIVGKGLINPVGTFWSIVVLLEHLDETGAARQVMTAVEAVTGSPALHTGDLENKATIAQVVQAVCQYPAANRTIKAA